MNGASKSSIKRWARMDAVTDNQSGRACRDMKPAVRRSLLGYFHAACKLGELPRDSLEKYLYLRRCDVRAVEQIVSGHTRVVR